LIPQLKDVFALEKTIVLKLEVNIGFDGVFRKAGSRGRMPDK
jgi:hypothetical protein